MLLIFVLNFLGVTKQHKRLFSLSVRLLHILNFKMSPLIEKYIGLDSQYKVAVDIILECREEIGLKENEGKFWCTMF